MCVGALEGEPPCGFGGLMESLSPYMHTLNQPFDFIRHNEEQSFPGQEQSALEHRQQSRKAVAYEPSPALLCSWRQPVGQLQEGVSGTIGPTLQALPRVQQRTSMCCCSLSFNTKGHITGAASAQGVF